jgi:hypothetical protein
MEKESTGWLEKIVVTIYGLSIVGGIVWGTYLLVRNIVRLLIK